MNIAISILLILVCLALIVSVLLQSSNQRGLGAIAGEMTANMNKTQAATVEKKLAMITKIAAVAFVVLSLVLWVLPTKTTESGSAAATAAPTAAVVEETGAAE